MIRRYAEDNYNLIILAGSQFEEVVSSVSGDYPKVDFCILNGRSASGKNTFSVYPKEEEASHLAGIIGGNLTKTGILGIIAGYPNEAMANGGGVCAHFAGCQHFGKRLRPAAG